MEYKIGDEVLLKGTVDRLLEDGYVIVNLFGADDESYKICPKKSTLVKDSNTEEETWELVKRIAALKSEDVKEIFGYYYTCTNIIRIFSYEEIKERIEVWDKKRNIRVGDEVIPKKDHYRYGERGIVVVCYCDGRVGVSYCGNDFAWYDKDSLEKTGRHIDFDKCLK
jgi:hypothetical protein